MVHDTFYSVSPAAYAVFLKVLADNPRDRHTVYPAGVIGSLLTHGLIKRRDYSGYYVPPLIQMEHDEYLKRRVEKTRGVQV